MAARRESTDSLDPYGYNYGIDEISDSGDDDSFSSSTLSHEDDDLDEDDDGFLGWNHSDDNKKEERRARRREKREDQQRKEEQARMKEIDARSPARTSGTAPGVRTGSDSGSNVAEDDADPQRNQRGGANVGSVITPPTAVQSSTVGTGGGAQGGWANFGENDFEKRKQPMQSQSSYRSTSGGEPYKEEKSNTLVVSSSSDVVDASSGAKHEDSDDDSLDNSHSDLDDGDDDDDDLDLGSTTTEEEGLDGDAADDDQSHDDDAGEEWSVRVRLISAVDLPPSLTPNTPLCPLLKFGLITSRNVGSVPDEPALYPSTGEDDDDRSMRSSRSNRSIHSERSLNSMVSLSSLHDELQSANKSQRESQLGAPSSFSADVLDSRNSVVARIEKHGLTSMPRARVRCSSGKILSQRDNGSAEWHEEMRWDGVRKPLQTVLAVEFCARAILPPPSPPTPKRADGITPGMQDGMGSAGGGLSLESDLPGNKFSLSDDPKQANNGELDYDNLYQQAISQQRGSSGGSGNRRASDFGSEQQEIEMDAIGNQNKNLGGGGPPANVSGTGRISSMGFASRWGGGGGGGNAQDGDQQGGLQGLRSLWRKGRQQLEQSQQARQQGKQGHHSRKSNSAPQDEMEAARAASAVARYIMEKQAKEEEMETEKQLQELESSAMKPSTDVHIDPLTGKSNDEWQSGWQREGERKRSEPGDDSTDDDHGEIKYQADMTPEELAEEQKKENENEEHEQKEGEEQQDKERPKKKRKLEMVEDLRLGSLVIPLSRLPLEDATCGNGAAVVEKWYQLDTTQEVAGGRDADSRSAAKKALSPRRCPSVLLEISFCSAQYLDESEDEVDDDDGNDVLWGDESEDQLGELGESKRKIFDQQFADSSFGDLDEFHNSNSDIHRRSSFKTAKATSMAEGNAASSKNRKNSVSQKGPAEPEKPEEPVLEPGIVDFVCVVGARDIGNQRNDDGSKGWVQSTPECCVLEQFPPNDEYHLKHGRQVGLPPKVEWFCFPEGCRLWRGSEPPTHMDLNLKRFSASSPPSIASSIAAFDACLNCTTSFSWFVMSSNSDEYGSKNLKTYGAVIRFYAPAPPGIDPTQDDYAQAVFSPEPTSTEGSSGAMGAGAGGLSGPGGSAGQYGGSGVYGNSMKRGKGRPDTLADVASKSKRLWVPMGICLTSNLPIIGVLEAMLLRLCESLASRANSTNPSVLTSFLKNDLAHLIVNFQQPIEGVLHCSIPFLSGERLHVTLPPPTGLPSLPHGAAVTSVCRLLGAEGLTVLLAAVLTECKILIHSSDVANLAMVAEVVTALIYPFTWQLPYIPVLPDSMLEFVEAPLSYFLGVPTYTMQFIDKAVLNDIVVIDLDNGFSSPDYFDGRRGVRATKLPTPLPASVSSNISKAVFRLLREEEEVEEQYGATTISGARHLPRLEGESLAEREFRIAVAIQICGLVRSYQECLFFVSASQPVFNRDRFLRNAPALYEERRGSIGALTGPHGPNQPVGVGGHHHGQHVGQGVGGHAPQRISSPRSKRFLSLLVNTQQFHQLLERLDCDDTSFFHEVMDQIETNDERSQENNSVMNSLMMSSAKDGRLSGYGSSDLDDSIEHLGAVLEKVEEKIPTYRVDRKDKTQRRSTNSWEDDDDDDDMDGFDDMLDGGDDDDVLMGFDHDDGGYLSSFTHKLLQPIVIGGQSNTTTRRPSGDSTTGEGVHTLSLQYLVELEKSPWRYCKVLDVNVEDSDDDEDEGSEPKDPGSPSSQEEKEIFYIEVRPKVKLRDAIGERKFRAWKLAQEKKQLVSEDSTKVSSDFNIDNQANALDLTSLLSSVTDETSLESMSTHSMTSDEARSRSGYTPEDQRVADAKDRDVLRRCLERAYEGAQHSQGRPRYARRRSSGIGSAAMKDSFQENGRDLVVDAEAALRNPSAQRFLISVLSQRTRLENQRKRRQGHDDVGGKAGSRHRQSGPGSVSRLQPNAFECLVRLCCAMLEACMEAQDYESAYQLLTHTAGFCTVVPTGLNASSNDTRDNNAERDHTKIVYMTGRIGMHPIFADLRLWERVLLLHQNDQKKDKGMNGAGSTNSSGRSSPTENRGGGNGEGKEGDDNDEYEAVVSTLYEMIGYGVPSEELARFATRVSEERGWFNSERGHALLVLARRLSVRRDEGDMEGTAGGAGELDLMGNGSTSNRAGQVGGSASGQGPTHGALGIFDHQSDFNAAEGVVGDLTNAVGGGAIQHEKAQMEWEEIAWCHPGAPLQQPQRERRISGVAAAHAAAQAKGVGRGPGSSRGGRGGGYNLLGSMLGGTGAGARGPSNSEYSPLRTQNLSASPLIPHHAILSSTGDDDILDPSGYMGRAAVTAMASFGASVVATGGLDGSVFLAHTIRFGAADEDKSQERSSWNSSNSRSISGVRLEWGSAGSTGAFIGSKKSAMDGGFGVGAVSCLAAARGANYRAGQGADSSDRSSFTDEEELLQAMEGCRIVAGTTGGDLRVWSVKDVYEATVLSQPREGGGSSIESSTDGVASAMNDLRINPGGTANDDAFTSSFVRGSERMSKVGGDISSPGASAGGRLKHALRGRALSGHRGGVTCVDVPSHIYRPDAVVSGGADGLIKLWSLRQTIRRMPSKATSVGNVAARHALAGSGASARGPGGLFGNRQSSAGNVPSGNDATGMQGKGKFGSSSEPQSVLTGHGGRVLCVKTAWHGDRLLSGGADRTVRLWDLAGSGGKCLHTLYGHLGWVTHAQYWGPHAIVSASTDRSIALWDARVGASPLFVLRYHKSPVSDILLGSRTEPLMVSAGGDGTVATWDFRSLSGAGMKESLVAADNKSSRHITKTIREPVATMDHCSEMTKVKCSGTVLLSRGTGLHEKSVLSASLDGILKEWDIGSGRLLGEQPTGHSDVLSCLSTFAESDGLRRGHSSKRSSGVGAMGGTITSSWDGTVRLRRLVLQHSDRMSRVSSRASSDLPEE